MNNKPLQRARNYRSPPGHPLLDVVTAGTMPSRIVDAGPDHGFKEGWQQRSWYKRMGEDWCQIAEGALLNEMPEPREAVASQVALEPLSNLLLFRRMEGTKTERVTDVWPKGIAVVSVAGDTDQGGREAVRPAPPTRSQTKTAESCAERSNLRFIDGDLPEQLHLGNLPRDVGFGLVEYL